MEAERDRVIAARAAEVGERLRVRGVALALAESCTGGGVADSITNVPGSSDYFRGGVVAYSNDSKARLLGVDTALLAAQGAVSEPVALAMAEGARRVFGAEVGVGITGIAGPGGGTPGKPVGLVFIAVSSPEGNEVRRFAWSGDRIANKRRSVEAALDMVLEHLA